MRLLHPDSATFRPARSRWLRLAFLIAGLVMVIVVYATSVLLTDRFTEATRQRADSRLAARSGELVTLLRQQAVVPFLLASDPELIEALNSGDYSRSTIRLIGYGRELQEASLSVLDTEAKTVASTNRFTLGEHHERAAYYIRALRTPSTVFTTYRDDDGRYRFAYSRRIEVDKEVLGVVVVHLDAESLETNWTGPFNAIMVVNSEGVIILASEARWRGRTEAEALAARSAPSAIQRALRVSTGLSKAEPDIYLQGQRVMRLEENVGFQGWKMVSFTAFTPVTERVNTVVALEIMGFALLIAAAFYLLSRRAQSRSVFFQRESAELRQLNAALQREIAERERAEKSLQVAEQTVEQTSKLAALGEMSAAVSHELNQPLAAMKTYLAGAKLLLQRRRPDEALSSFSRIDGLIERMGTITRQLKSYARKGGEALEPLDVRRSVSQSVAMMEPQLKSSDVRIAMTMPREPVVVMADPIRLEQVIINLLRNAVDATKEVREPEVEVMLRVGAAAVLTVRDNGTGIANFDNLFEPFYTTKAPGDGVGLGLAISSSIVSDLGGRLTARNGKVGAVFELRLPLAEMSMAAE